MTMLFFVAFLLLATVFIVKSATQSNPGKIALWVSSGKTESKYISRTLDISDAINVVDRFIPHADIVVMITPADIKQENTINFLSSFIQKSDSIIMPYVYNEKNPQLSLESQLLNSHSFQNAKKLSVDSLMSYASSKEDSQNVISVSITGTPDELKVLEKFHQMNTKILFVAVDEPAVASVATPSSSDAAAPLHGRYSRMLATSSTSDSKSLYYSPEGAEYSIYYADTYIYITPDITTGLLTAIFFAFVLYQGLSCLGGIQTPSLFASKLPPVGREV